MDRPGSRYFTDHKYLNTHAKNISKKREQRFQLTEGGLEFDALLTILTNAHNHGQFKKKNKNTYLSLKWCELERTDNLLGISSTTYFLSLTVTLFTPCVNLWTNWKGGAGERCSAPSGQVETPTALCSRQLCYWRAWRHWGFFWWPHCNVSWLTGSLLREAKDDIIVWQTPQTELQSNSTGWAYPSGRHRCPCSSPPVRGQGWCRLVSPAPSVSSPPGESIHTIRPWAPYTAHLGTDSPFHRFKSDTQKQKLI